MAANERIMTGFPSMDLLFDNLRSGDNVVWQTTDAADLKPFAQAFARQNVRDGRPVVYVRFAGHEPLLSPDTQASRTSPLSEAESDSEAEAASGTEQAGIRILHPELDHKFEDFTVRIYRLIKNSPPNTCYLFDSLSQLQTVWSTDLMMANFFSIIGPLVNQTGCCAWYPVIRGKHSFSTIAKIRDCTQVFADLYTDDDNCYIRPMKVWQRYSPTMFLPHIYEKKTGRFYLAAEGVSISHFYSLMNETMAKSEDQNEDSWDRFFRKTRMKHEMGGDISRQCRLMCSEMITRDEHLKDIVLENFTPQDYFDVRSHMIGTGMIGGKACGMLLARKIIRNRYPHVHARLEPHDSFYIGCDVFYSYIVHNRFWEMRVKQREEENYFALAPHMAELLKSGSFPPDLEEQFLRLLDYYGQDPFIVRSSSILEDGFGNAFAGKYESVFCSNSGSREENLTEFEDAVRTVYASTLSMGALEYRKRRGLEKQDEQMALLVQRVSGSRYGRYFLPACAGVGYSLSPYKFGMSQDEPSGMLRLVMGLGTSAVDRMQGSYPRLVSVDDPARQIIATSAERHQFSQRKIDLIDTEKRCFASEDLKELETSLPFYIKKVLLSHDYEAERYFRDMGSDRDIWYISCDGIVKNETLMQDFRDLLDGLQKEYHYPVDIEFTVNLTKEGRYVINLLQCRPLQAAKDYEVITLPESPDKDSIFLECSHASMGLSRKLKLDYIVMIDSVGYYRMEYKAKYEIARALGAVNWYLREQGKNLLLFAPGRICTSSPELGVPCSFAEISEFNAICEMSETGAGYMPELSYGSHIFQDLVEANILYTAVNDNNKTQTFAPEKLDAFPNLLAEMYPKGEHLKDIIRVCCVSDADCMLYYSMPEGRMIITLPDCEKLAPALQTTAPEGL